MDKKSFWKGRGFYMALALVIAGSAMASFLAINNMMHRIGTPSVPDSNITGEEEIPWTDTPVEQKAQDVRIASSSSSNAQSGAASSGAPAASSQQSAEPQELQTVQASLYVWPVKGKVSEAFSGEELVFNKTMQDWRTHNGTDIAADAGTDVKAPIDGTVSAVKADAQWGGVVEITAGETVVRVCGIEGVAVKQGDTVKAGAVLGKLGGIPAENSAGVHVHLEVSEKGKLADPAKYFS